MKAVEALGVRVENIYNTHGHLDHIGAVAELQESLEVPWWLHPEDAPVVKAANRAAAMYGLPPMRIPTADKELSDGMEVAVGSLKARVITTPGHTPGGVCFLFEEKELFTGDTLFAGGIGRSDLPGGDGRLLIKSIKERLLTLPEDIRIWPGHMGDSTIGQEKRANPFV
jgi:glyoxylase-like metal-dependent hydrolase (beta-lactamase superfamily II)